MKIIDINDIKLLNKQKGKFWFSPDTMRFFKSRVAQEAYVTNDDLYALFVSSESSPFDKGKRFYTVRVCNMKTGEIDNVCDFKEYRSGQGATNRAIKEVELYDSGNPGNWIEKFNPYIPF